jgi:hypothetical protein
LKLYSRHVEEEDVACIGPRISRRVETDHLLESVPPGITISSRISRRVETGPLLQAPQRFSSSSLPRISRRVESSGGKDSTVVLDLVPESQEGLKQDPHGAERRPQEVDVGQNLKKG